MRRALREPVVLAIGALALLTAASAAWTISEPGDALRWGAVVAGYAAIALAGFAAGRRCGAEPLAALLVGLAVATGVAGCVAAAIQAEPLAERIGGAWRPGGLFEYPPALGALQLAAAPLALRWMAAGGRRAAAGAAALAVVAAVVALVSSRAILALGALLLLAVAWRPERTLGCARPLALAAIGFALAVGAGADAVAGSYADPYTSTSDLPRVLGLALLWPASVGLWIAIRVRFDSRGRPRPDAARTAIALVCTALAIAATAAALTPDSGEAVEPDAGLTHGRVELWGDAIETATNGGFEGSGALTFALASRSYQEPSATRYAHNLVLESWVELGYPGLIASLALVAIAIALVLRSRGSPALWMLGPAAIAYLVASMIDWPWHVPASAATFAFILGGLAGAGSAGRSAPLTRPAAATSPAAR